MFRRLLIAALFALPALAQTSDLLPQQPLRPQRLKIGLVLEGGGAFGLAHIGVIEWLEDNHIPVDYVAGTSMGALVGGMYSMGYK
ncbi:MAG: patatin-like phospholipase family protein, partial [Terriglobales bacterium]